MKAFDELSEKRKKQSMILFEMLLTGSLLSYMSSSMAAVKVLGYGLCFVSLLGLAVTWPIISSIRMGITSFFCFLMGIFYLIPMFSSGEYNTLVGLAQTVMYPVTTFCFLLWGYRICLSRPYTIARYLLVFAVVNFIVAISASFGLISELPLIGEIRTGRSIFGTNIPSSTGLAMNVNYYSTIQATLFWLIFGLKKMERSRLSKLEICELFFVAVSSLVGSSRGVLVALIISVLFHTMILLLYADSKIRKKAFKWLALAGIASLILFLGYYDTIYYGFRIYKGMNHRDALWLAALELWTERPIWGWGAVEGLSPKLEVLANYPGSVHSGYFQTLYRGGLMLFLSVYGGIFFCVVYGLKLSRKLWLEYAWVVSLIVFVLVNMGVRSFSLGGMGLLPSALGIALSICLYAEVLYKNKILAK